MYIKVIYQSNYNGCLIFEANAEGYEVDTTKETTDICEAIGEATVDKFYTDCNDNGTFEGNINEVFAYAKEQLLEAFGSDTIVICEEDSVSS